MLKDFFPKDVTPRPQQLEALDKIEKIWGKGKKIAIGVLPTGSGKSHIAKTVCSIANDVPSHIKNLIINYEIYEIVKNKYKVEDDFFNEPYFGAFILTVTKTLQDQYQNLFPELITIKGKNNYQCEIDHGFTTEFAPCSLLPSQKYDCFSKNICPYYKNRNNGLADKTSSLNYSAYLKLPTFLQKRQILVLDEAAELEEELVSRYSTSLNYKMLKFEGVLFKNLKETTNDAAKTWLYDILVKLEDILIDSFTESKKQFNKNKTVNQTLVKKINRLKNLISSVESTLKYWDQCSFLIESLNNEEVVFAPYDVRPLARKMFDNSQKILMLSATISDPEEYAKSLGIEKDEYEYFEVESTFPPEKSPIICSSQHSLSYKTMENVLPKVIECALEICENHNKEKGIIHTYTNKIVNEFKKKVTKNLRFLYRETGVTNEQILENHFKSDLPTVLVSPSLDTGVSLDGELGRFQIIMKAPYMSLASNRIKKMFKENPKKYNMKMLDKLIQMAGRCTRSVDDYSITYILDGTATKAIKRSSEKLPKHFLARFK
jgi:Rad3-related DNA helicase